jgi:hypothetical protein
MGSTQTSISDLKEEIEEIEGFRYVGVPPNYREIKPILAFVFRKGNHWVSLVERNDRTLVSVLPIDPSETEFIHEIRFTGYIDTIEDFEAIIRILEI